MYSAHNITVDDDDDDCDQRITNIIYNIMMVAFNIIIYSIT